MSEQKAARKGQGEYDLIVVGAGVAGSEAASAVAAAGMRVLLVSSSLDTVYNLAADSAVLEPPDGSLMARVVRAVASSGGAVSAWELHRRCKYALEATAGLHLLQSTVVSVLTSGGAVSGVTTWEGVDRLAPRVALCVGSFLEARLKVGDSVEQAGRLSETAYDDLYLHLLGRGFEFVPAAARGPGGAGALPHVVEFQQFVAADVVEHRLGSVTIRKLAGLYAAGACVEGAGATYEAAARDGMALAARVLDDAGA